MSQWTFTGSMTGLLAGTTSDSSTSLFVVGVLVIDLRVFVLGMSELTVGSFGTEANVVVCTESLLDVASTAVRPVFAEAAGEPGTRLGFQFVDNVPVGALGVGALRKRPEEPARRHLAHVVLVQKLALRAFLAETSKPMLAHK